MKEIETNLTEVHNLTVLSDGTVVACGGRKLTLYDLETGRVLGSSGLNRFALGMGEVKFRSQSSLVLSYG